jgi:hypothetical protein
MSTEELNELMRRSEALSEEEKMPLATHLVDRARTSHQNGFDAIRDDVDANAPDAPDPERRRSSSGCLSTAQNMLANG